MLQGQLKSLTSMEQGTYKGPAKVPACAGWQPHCGSTCQHSDCSMKGEHYPRALCSCTQQAVTKLGPGVHAGVQAAFCRAKRGAFLPWPSILRICSSSCNVGLESRVSFLFLQDIYFYLCTGVFCICPSVYTSRTCCARRGQKGVRFSGTGVPAVSHHTSARNRTWSSANPTSALNS